MWSSKWNIKDEHNKLLNELGGAAGTGNGGATGNGGGGGGGGGGAGSGNATGYYEHGGFPGNAIATSAELYDSLGTISTMTQAQTPHLYTPPIGGTIGEKLLNIYIHIYFYLTLLLPYTPPSQNIFALSSIYHHHPTLFPFPFLFFFFLSKIYIRDFFQHLLSTLFIYEKK